jgi:hypothetical protein
MSRKIIFALVAGMAISILLVLPAAACSHSPKTTLAPSMQVSLISEYNPALKGDTVTFFAIVKEPGVTLSPTGTMTFKDGSTVLGTVNVDANGLAIWTALALSPGNHQISASYSGDSTFPAAVSPSVLQMVNIVVNGTTMAPTTTAGPTASKTATPPPTAGSTEPAVVD